MPKIPDANSRQAKPKFRLPSCPTLGQMVWIRSLCDTDNQAVAAKPVRQSCDRSSAQHPPELIMTADQSHDVPDQQFPVRRALGSAAHLPHDQPPPDAMESRYRTSLSCMTLPGRNLIRFFYQVS